jgi:Tn3 transposase DDE domain
VRLAFLVLGVFAYPRKKVQSRISSRLENDPLPLLSVFIDNMHVDDHQLRRTISYANYGKLRFGTEYEQHLWSECSRLIANCIIFYNATLLSKLLAHKESQGDMQGAALVKQASPVAWQHVNLYGRYEFRKKPEPVDVDEIVRELAEIRIGTVTPKSRSKTALESLVIGHQVAPICQYRAKSSVE